jgi:hypothetical protein
MMSFRIASRRLATPASSYSRRASSSGFRYFASVTTTSGDASTQGDPMEIFDMIDTNKDGILSKEEFRSAVSMMHYEDLLKMRTSLSRNELSYNSAADEDQSLEETGDSVFGRRLYVTVEVAVSKLFPAGFGWQTAATLLDNANVQSTDFAFFLGTGLGDGFGVFLGHTVYMACKKAITGDQNLDLLAQSQTGFMLGSAAVCSGGVWQPTVNALQAAGWSFDTAVVATGGVAVLAFFTGLRLTRIMYGNVMAGVETPTYANLKADAALSVAVGGAAGCFLGTDITYEAANWLRPVVGIEETASALASSVLAGSSTALGFFVVQMGENAVYPKDKCWVD